jgi:hypothetical protein
VTPLNGISRRDTNYEELTPAKVLGDWPPCNDCHKGQVLTNVPILFTLGLWLQDTRLTCLFRSSSGTKTIGGLRS